VNNPFCLFIASARQLLSWRNTLPFHQGSLKHGRCLVSVTV